MKKKGFVDCHIRGPLGMKYYVLVYLISASKLYNIKPKERKC